MMTFNKAGDLIRVFSRPWNADKSANGGDAAQNRPYRVVWVDHGLLVANNTTTWSTWKMDQQPAEIRELNIAVLKNAEDGPWRQVIDWIAQNLELVEDSAGAQFVTVFREFLAEAEAGENETPKGETGAKKPKGK